MSYPTGSAVAGASPDAIEAQGDGMVPAQLPRLGPGDTPADPFEPLGEELGPSVVWLVVRDAGLRFADGSSEMTVAVLARDGALDHVEVLDGSPGPGLWLSDRAQHVTQLAPGDLAYFSGTHTGVPVARIYRDETVLPPDNYWCTHADLGRDLTLADANDLVTELSCGTGTAPGLTWCEGVDNSGGAITGPAPDVLIPVGQTGRPGLAVPTADQIEYRDADASCRGSRYRTCRS